MLPGLLLWLLPAAFMLHDAEEAVFLPGWLRRNRDALARRFPRISRRLLPRLEHLTALRFAAMAAEELILLTAVTAYAVSTGNCYPWLALFLAFGIHLLLHLVQWIAVGRYVPVVATSLIGLVYCGWGIHVLKNSRLFTLREAVLCAVAGCVAAGVNLLLLHRLAGRRR